MASKTGTSKIPAILNLYFIFCEESGSRNGLVQIKTTKELLLSFSALLRRSKFF